MKCEYQFCGKEFTGRSDKRFCSNTCRTYASHGSTTIPGWRERKAIENAPKTNIYIKTCPNTGLLFVTKYPNKVYHPASPKYKLIPRIKLNCGVCGNDYLTINRDSKGLCFKCRIRDEQRINKSKRRAAERANIVEHVVPYTVFTRDAWTCKICGISTPRHLLGKRHNNSPEMDHIIPISKGGSHSYSNVQCACKRCNNIKSNKVITVQRTRLYTDG